MTKTTKRKAMKNKVTDPAPLRGRGPNRRSARTMLTELRRRLLEIDALTAAASLLNWDQATYMPKGGAGARGRQNATLHRLAHEQLIDPAMGKLLDALASCADNLSPDSDEASLIRVARRDFEKAIKVPAEHVARANALGSASYDAWTRARPANDFATMLPFLEKTLDFSREYAGFFAPYEHIADPLIDDADEGMTTASIHTLFSQLGSELVPIVRAISDQPPTDDSCLHGSFGEKAQLDFGPQRLAMTSSAGGLIGRIIRSAPSFRRAMCALPPASLRATSLGRCFRRCTRPAMRFTSRE